VQEPAAVGKLRAHGEDTDQARTDAEDARRGRPAGKGRPVQDQSRHDGQRLVIGGLPDDAGGVGGEVQLGGFAGRAVHHQGRHLPGLRDSKNARGGQAEADAGGDRVSPDDGHDLARVQRDRPGVWVGLAARHSDLRPDRPARPVVQKQNLAARPLAVGDLDGAVGRGGPAAACTGRRVLDDIGERRREHRSPLAEVVVVAQVAGLADGRAEVIRGRLLVVVPGVKVRAARHRVVCVPRPAVGDHLPGRALQLLAPRGFDAVAAHPAGPELGAEPGAGTLGGVERRVAGGVVIVIQAAEEQRHGQAHPAGLGEVVLVVGVRQVRAAADAAGQDVLVFELDHDDRPTARDLISGNDREELVPVRLHGGVKLGVVGHGQEAGLEAQPDRQAARIPLGVDIRTGADDGIHIERLHGLQEGVQVLLAFEVELAFVRFVVVPKGVGLDGVVTRPLDPQQAVPPQGARSPRVVHIARDDERPLAVDQKPVPVEVDRRLCGGERREDAVVVVGPAESLGV